MSTAPQAGLIVRQGVGVRWGPARRISGRMRSVLGQPHFRLPSSCVMTQLSEPSLPAAEMVSTVPIGRVCSILAFPVKKSQKSPS